MTPPLLGDTNGKYRVHIVGNSGAGKSTMGRELAAILGVPFISLDTLHWNPGWRESSADEMRKRIQETLLACPDGWVIDGNYTRKGGDLVESSATDRVWLDPPLALYLPRLILRTFKRLFRLGEPCSPGCDERFTEVFFSKDSIIWWCISHHSIVRRRERENFGRIGIDAGTDVARRKMRRIGGWGGELRAWLDAVKVLVRSRIGQSV
ncbi:hypothetical protein MKEN_00501700 [Mycena kentingensis (nom. inval.)]|nr:hypothetical protein MKEN_00501700 [Mycena kentingensis (nom. inval.)]